MNKFSHNFSNFFLDIFSKKGFPLTNDSISISVSSLTVKSLLAFSQYIFNLILCFIYSSLFKSIFVFFLNCSIQNFIKILSKSSPPKCIIPLCASTLISSFSISNNVTSKVPPPKSNTIIFLISLLLFL